MSGALTANAPLSVCGVCFCVPCLTPVFCNLCREDEAGRQQTPVVEPKKRGAPRTTIEAIMWCIRERGPEALHEPTNIERLSRCDHAAITEIDARITKLSGGHAR
jgi:hypothetical protein